MSGLALFGGTFDPIHNAHLQIAQAAADRCGLERILFVPSGTPPHRADGTFASYQDRYAMVELACQLDPRFEPSRLEEGQGKSYSIDTVDRVRTLCNEPLHFLIGADAFAEIHTWHRWQELVSRVIFVVVSRPGAQFRVPAGANVVGLEGLELLVSSSEIRKALALGATNLPLPPAVYRYLQRHQLYRSLKRS